MTATLTGQRVRTVATRGTKVNALKALLQVRRDLKADISAVELLKQTPLTRLEELVKTLKEHRSLAEIREAMVERIARAPLAEFEALKSIYLMHCVDATEHPCAEGSN